MKKSIEILRTFDSRIQTEGILYVLNSGGKIIFECFTLELPWKNNERRVSCIPAGKYRAKMHNSPKFGRCLWIQNVPNRSEILIHKGNYHTDILGCILVGDTFKDINRDGQNDVLNSYKTMIKIMDILGGQVEVEVDVRYV